jgi:hypothetical protein
VITPKILAFHSLDVDDLQTYQPPGEQFALLVQMLIGPDVGEGQEAFDVQVVTPAWLEQRYAGDGLVGWRRAPCGLPLRLAAH